MSFSYWRGDKITLQKPLAKHRPGPGGIGSRRNGPAVPSGYSREPSANAKFGNRLIPADSSLVAARRPTSRRNGNTLGRRPSPEDAGTSVRTSVKDLDFVTRPAWDGITRPGRTLTSDQSHNTAQHNAARNDTAAPSDNKILASPSSSEDSVGFLSLEDSE